MADVHCPSPRSRVPTPASHSGSKIVAAGEVYVEEQVDVPVPSEKGKEKAKATEPEIERELMEDGDLGDADCIARELLCDSPDDQGKDKHLDGRGSAGSSSDEDEDEEEGDELMALSTDYLQRCVFLYSSLLVSQVFFFCRFECSLYLTFCCSIDSLISHLSDILMLLGTSTFSTPTVLNWKWRTPKTRFSHVGCITSKNPRIQWPGSSRPR